jgi:hypothetical protein
MGIHPVARPARDGIRPWASFKTLWARQTPLSGGLLDAAREKLTEAARLLDLSEHRFGQLLSQAIRAGVATGLDIFGSLCFAVAWLPHIRTHQTPAPEPGKGSSARR